MSYQNWTVNISNCVNSLIPPESQRDLFPISSTCWLGPGTSGTWSVLGFQTRRSFWRPQRSLCGLSQTHPLLNASFHHTLVGRKQTSHSTQIIIYVYSSKAQHKLTNSSRSYIHHHTSDNSHYEWVGDGRFNMKGLLIQGFQFLVIFLCGVHLNLQSIDLQQLRSLLQVVFSIICLSLQTLEQPHFRPLLLSKFS